MESVKNLILIHGDEEYMKTEKKKELLSFFACEGSPDFNVFSGDDTDFEEVLDLAETMPMFGGRRVLLLDDTGFLNTGASQGFLDRLKDLPDSTTVIFYEYDSGKKKKTDTEDRKESPETGSKDSAGEDNSGRDAGDTESGEENRNRSGRSRFLKFMEANGTVFLFKQVSSLGNGKLISAGKTEIRGWIRKSLSQAGKRIDSRAVEEMVELAGYDMMNLRSELDKLVSCPEEPVTVNTVRTICSRTVQEKIFEIINHKLQGNVSDALLLFEDLLSIRTSPMQVLTLLGKQFLTAFSIKDLEARRFSDAEILAELGLKDWQLRNYRKFTVSRSASDLLYYSSLCSEMDARIKSGDMPERIAVEIILCS